MRPTRLGWLFFLALCLALFLTLPPSIVHAGGLTVTPTHGGIGTSFEFTGTGFQPNENVALWLNYPDGRVIGQGNTPADANGVATFTVSPVGDYPFGYYVQVAHGLRSSYEITAGFNYDSPQSSSGGGGGSGSSGCANGNFAATGFTPGETAATWTTRPDGVSLALPNAKADDNGLVNFTFVPQAGWPSGSYIVVAFGYTSKLQGVNTFDWDGVSLRGGGSCAESNSPGSSAAPAPQPGASPVPAVIAPKNIVNPQGPAVYLNSIPDELYYFDCSWKWRPMGGTMYFMTLGFQPYEKVDVFYQILEIQDMTYFTSLIADGNGNVSMSVDTSNMTLGHYHWWFSGKSASYCGHYDLLHF